MAKKETVKDIDELFDGQEKMNLTNIKNPNYRKIVVKRIEIYNKLGLLD